MEKFTIILLGTIFAALITSSIESVHSDHLSGGDSVFIAMEKANFAVPIKDSKYEIYAQAVVRNADGQLIYVNQGSSTAFIPHKITDYVFDELMGEKEIITIDSIKYEKTQFSFVPTLQQRYMSMYPIFLHVDGTFEVKFTEESITQMHEEHWVTNNWKLHYCANWGEGHPQFDCVPIFQVLVPSAILEPSDTVTIQWTILRVIE